MSNEPSSYAPIDKGNSTSMVLLERMNPPLKQMNPPLANKNLFAVKMNPPLVHKNLFCYRLNLPWTKKNLPGDYGNIFLKQMNFPTITLGDTVGDKGGGEQGRAAPIVSSGGRMARR